MDNFTTKKNLKNFDNELKIIENLESLDDTPIKLVGNLDAIATLTKRGENLILKINNVFDIGETEISTQIRIDGDDYVLSSHNFVSSSFQASKSSGVSRQQIFDVKEIKKLEFKNDTYSKFRCFFPTNIEKLKTFIYMCKTLKYEDNTTVFGYDCIRITIDNKTYDILQLKNNGKGYYVFESIENESLEIFKENCFAIQQALGFLIGYMPGGESYIFSEDKFTYSTYVRPALESLYFPVNTNPYSKLYNNKEVAEEYIGKLTLISPETFSILVKQIKVNPELSSAIILLMEATSMKSLLMMPSVFAVIIEALSKIISIEEKGKVLAIKNKETEKHIISELIKVIDKNSNDLEEEGILKLKRRLLEINKPIVKERLINIDKLTRPFEQLGITLTIDDISVIEHRNDLLHGNIHMNNREIYSTEEINHYMAYVSGKLYTLISKLILKNAKYRGFVINYAKFHSDHAINEYFYDEI